MLLGHGRADITPTEPFYLLGYKTPLRNEPAKGIHDHIFINGLLFHKENGENVFLATGDLLEIEDIVAADIRQKISSRFDIPFENIIIGVTHDHHSVRDYHRSWEFGKFSQKYYDFFVDSFIEVYQQCLDSLTEVTAKYGDQMVIGYYGNRDHPGELSDNLVEVVKFYHEGQAIAGIVNLAVHSTVLSAKNQYLTADLAGNLCTELEKSWGFYPVMLIGCAGDSSNHYQRQGRDFAELERTVKGIGEILAPVKTDRVINLDHDQVQVVTLAQENVNDKEKYDASLRRMIADLKSGKKTEVGSQSVEHVIEKCEEQLKQPQFHDVIAMQLLDIGDLRFFIFPGELASAGAEILRASTEKTVLIAGYANGFHYYFLRAEDYGLSFETIGNPVPAGTFEEIIAKFVRASQMLDCYEKNKN